MHFHLTSIIIFRLPFYPHLHIQSTKNFSQPMLFHFVLINCNRQSIEIIFEIAKWNNSKSFRQCKLGERGNEYFQQKIHVIKFEKTFSVAFVIAIDEKLALMTKYFFWFHNFFGICFLRCDSLLVHTHACVPDFLLHILKLHVVFVCFSCSVCCALNYLHKYFANEQCFRVTLTHNKNAWMRTHKQKINRNIFGREWKKKLEKMHTFELFVGKVAVAAQFTWITSVKHSFENHTRQAHADEKDRFLVSNLFFLGTRRIEAKIIAKDKIKILWKIIFSFVISFHFHSIFFGSCTNIADISAI